MAWREMVAGSLVAAVVAAAAAGAAAGGAARGAVTILVVAVAARGPRVVREAVPIENKICRAVYERDLTSKL
jgi:ABC-type glycerol-3-phosphate transport system substrate-binding protein